MSAMHDDKWVAESSRPDPQAEQLRKVFTDRDKCAADTGEVSEYWDDLVRDRVAAAERATAATNPPGRWQPDEWETKARAVLDYRDRIADSVAGPVPSIGTPEWAAADWRTQTAAYARHERDVAAAQGKAISNRMAAETGRRRDLVEASHAVSAGWDSSARVSFAELQRRRSEVAIPEPRQPTEWTPAPTSDAGAARVRVR